MTWLSFNCEAWIVKSWKFLKAVTLIFYVSLHMFHHMTTSMLKPFQQGRHPGQWACWTKLSLHKSFAQHGRHHHAQLHPGWKGECLYLHNQVRNNWTCFTNTLDSSVHLLTFFQTLILVLLIVCRPKKACPAVITVTNHYNYRSNEHVLLFSIQNKVYKHRIHQKMLENNHLYTYDYWEH